MLARLSIALRLSLSLAVMTGLLWLAAASISATVMRSELNEAFDETLRQSAFRLLPLAIAGLRETRPAAERQMTDLTDDGDGDDDSFSYFVRDRAGVLQLSGAGLPENVGQVTTRDGFGELDGRRLFAVTDTTTGYGIVVLETPNHRGQALAESISALAWPLIGLLPLIALAIWFAVRLALRPLGRLRRDIASRDAHNLSPLRASDHPAELAPIAEAIADLLARLSSAMDAERAFAASSAHELRTPIAGALAQTQQLALELAGNPAAGRIGEIETALRHLSGLSEKLLQLSRLDAGFARAEGVLDVLPVLRLIVRDFNARALSTREVKLVEGEASVLALAISPDAFAVAVTNLVQNGLSHGSPHTPVVITVGPGAVVAVQNAGPVVLPETLARLGRPFTRGNAVSSGTGLGLSIARSIAEQTGGTLRLCSPAPRAKDGFVASLAWPSAAHDQARLGIGAAGIRSLPEMLR